MRLPHVPLSAQATNLPSDSPVPAGMLLPQAEQVRERFLKECVGAGVKSFDAVIDGSDHASSFVQHAYCNDLTILTKADPKAPDHCATEDFVEYVVLHSARPTLILPFAAGRFSAIGTIGTNVLVAWNDSREAARALSDALPLLRLAKQVHVMLWNEWGGDGHESQGHRFDALHQWLTRHGVSANIEVQTTEIGIVDSLLARAAELKTDLVVMGAYSHRPSSGYTTRALLAAITVSVLTSH